MKLTKVQKKANILHQIAKASDAVRRKHEIIKHGRETTARAMDEMLKPLVTPLQQLVEKTPIDVEKFERKIKKEELKKDEDLVEKIPSFQTTVNDNTTDYGMDNDQITDDESFTTAPFQSTPKKDPLATLYLKKFSSKHGIKELDTKFGVRKLKNKLMVGNAEARFDDQFIYIGNKRYESTPGLLELLFMESPNPKITTESDEKTYGQILINTHAFHKHYHPDRSIRENKYSSKYRHIISKFLPKSGEGLPKYMINHNQPLDYIYWDDPNELVDRLRLLVASRSAGNSGHNNEIISIIEELREAEIIY